MLLMVTKYQAVEGEVEKEEKEEKRKGKREEEEVGETACKTGGGVETIK